MTNINGISPAISRLVTGGAAACLLLAAASDSALAQRAAKSDEYADFNPGRSTIGSDWVQSISVKSPQLGSEIKGNVNFVFAAPGMTVARALCWQQPTAQNPDPVGHDTVIGAEIKLDAQGNGSFVFPADQYPNGPITVRILTNNADSSLKDIYEVQLYNTGGVKWNQGVPKNDPPAASGMKLVFADDFNGPLSISKDGKGARYSAHKPGGGDFSGWLFSDPTGSLNPFSHDGTFLRIHASKTDGGKGSTGILSSMAGDGSGFSTSVPCYLECRFLAQSAPGTWPAFWTLTCDGALHKTELDDELDIIEGYGGVGRGNPNSSGYSVTSHFWKQNGPDGKPLPPINKRIEMLNVGSKSYWSTTFHTYAVKVTEKDTIYYLDDIEVLRHPTGPVSKSSRLFFMINYAIGGISGWHIDMQRYGNVSDMWVDYVRVYHGQ